LRAALILHGSCCRELAGRTSAAVFFAALFTLLEHAMQKSDTERHLRPSGSQLEHQVRRTVEKHRMLKAGEKLLVAVSGGADSVALLHVLRRLQPAWNLSLAVAHFNHCLRGEDSEADEEFVRGLSSTLGIPFLSERADVRQNARARKSNLEESARSARYDFLRRAAAQIGADKIALGHNQNDQAETVLMRILRGSGQEGFSSIHPVVDGLFIRPLIDCPRKLILRYLADWEHPYRQDISNNDLGYLRNRVRHQLLPYLLRRFNPRLINILANEAEQARLATQFLQAQARQVCKSIRVEKQDVIALPLRTIQDLHPALRSEVIREALRDCRGSLRGISSAHIQSILNLCTARQSGRQIQLPGKYRVTRRFNDLVFLSGRPAEKGAYYYELPLPGTCLISEVGLEISIRLDLPPEGISEEIGPVRMSDLKGLRSILQSNLGSDGPLLLPEARTYLDVSTLPGGLVVRPRQPGDRYGGPGHRKVKKMLIDAKMDPQIRARLPLLVAGEAVVWIPGFLPASRFRLRPGSGRAALVTVRSMPS
jgi:tRNA(Ile)-lysidine synthase